MSSSKETRCSTCYAAKQVKPNQPECRTSTGLVTMGRARIFDAAHCGPYARLLGFLVSFFRFLRHGLKPELLLRQDARLSPVGGCRAVYCTRTRAHKSGKSAHLMNVCEHFNFGKLFMWLYAVGGVQVSTVSERKPTDMTLLVQFAFVGAVKQATAQ